MNKLSSVWVYVMGALYVACGLLLVSCDQSGKSPVPDLVVASGAASGVASGSASQASDFIPAASIGKLSIPQALAVMEQSGEIPVLDRSSDLKGPDTNNNGIRDDLDVWIAQQKLPASQQKALEQNAKVLQKVFSIDLNSREQRLALDYEDSLASNCTYLKFGEKNRYKINRDIEHYTFNTKERFVYYWKYNNLLSGESFQAPIGDTCE